MRSEVDKATVHRFGDRVLHRAELAPDPLAQVRLWSAAAADFEIDVHAMVLCTNGLDGWPSSRTVGIKEVTDRGVVFTSHLEAVKSHELNADGRASAVIYWPSVGRQVRILGEVHPLSTEVAADYFAGRPRAAQIALHVARPSQAIPQRSWLDARRDHLDASIGDDIPLPSWGAFELQATIVEFWQGRTDRLHDRFRYERDAGSASWHITRLTP